MEVTAGELLSPFLNKWGARPHRQFQKSWLVAFAIALSHNRAAIAREVLERDQLWLLASSIALTGSVDRLWLLASSIALTGSVDHLSLLASSIAL